MKQIKILAIAIPLALALGAALANTASAATVFCASENPVCPEGDVEPAGTVSYGNVEPAEYPENNYFKVVSSSGNTFSCEHSALGGISEASSGSPLPMTFEGYDPFGCTLNGNPSVISGTSLSSPLPAQLKAFGEGKGVLLVGTSTEHFSIGFKTTMFGVTCVYGKSTAFFVVDGPNYEMTANTGLVLESGPVFACGETATLTFAASLSGGGQYVAVI